MDYFKILNLNREPFSNSPEPDFFYESSQHLGCLQKLEIAVRLRRGLSVVMGNVGTGKTTLCRELLIRFAKSEDDRNEVETHLLLDPSIGTPANSWPPSRPPSAYLGPRQRKASGSSRKASSIIFSKEGWTKRRRSF